MDRNNPPIQRRIAAKVLCSFERGRLKTSCHGDTLEPSKRTGTASAAYEVALLHSNAERIAVVHGDAQ